MPGMAPRNLPLPHSPYRFCCDMLARRPHLQMSVTHRVRPPHQSGVIDAPDGVPVAIACTSADLSLISGSLRMLDEPTVVQNRRMLK
jgi:hypothetical protein